MIFFKPDVRQFRSLYNFEHFSVDAAQPETVKIGHQIDFRFCCL